MFEKGHRKYGGKKKGFKSGYSREEIEAAFEAAKEKHDGISLLEHLCDLAYEDKAIAIAMLRKLVPDLRSLQLDVNSVDENDFATKQAETLSMIERSTNGSAHLMGQVKDLLGQIKVGMTIDAGIVAEIEKLMKPLEIYCNGGLVCFPMTSPVISAAGDPTPRIETTEPPQD